MDPVKMPSHTAIGELPEHQWYAWPQAVYCELKRHLNERRDDIAEILSIDIDDWEAWARAPRKRRSARPQSDGSAAPAHHAEPCFARVFYIDFVIDEIALALVNFDAALMNVNSLASLPKRRHILQQIIKRSRISEQEIELLDPGVREHLAFYYPCGLDRFAPGKVKSSDVRAAAKTALASLPQPRRGRPKGSGNDAALSLARELAAIYENHSEAKPTRSVVVSKSLDLNVPNSRESGKFLKFFEIVTGALTFDAREKLTRAGGGFPALIRTALETRYPA